jgi:hypothetical protein
VAKQVLPAALWELSCLVSIKTLAGLPWGLWGIKVLLVLFFSFF